MGNLNSRKATAINPIPNSLRKRVLKDGEIGFLCPSYEGFLSLREEHFLGEQVEIDVQADGNCSM